jgi:hypothetical protein
MLLHVVHRAGPSMARRPIARRDARKRAFATMKVWLVATRPRPAPGTDIPCIEQIVIGVGRIVIGIGLIVIGMQ